MPVLLLLTLSWSVALASTLLCNITETVRTSEKDGKYFSLETNNICYVFSLRKVDVQRAQRFCRSIGGSLTDVESRTDNLLQVIQLYTLILMANLWHALEERHVCFGVEVGVAISAARCMN